MAKSDTHYSYKTIGNLKIKSGYRTTKSGRVDVAEITPMVPVLELTDEDNYWLDRYEKQGYQLVPKREVSNSRMHKKEWFEENCKDTAEKNAFHKQIKEHGYMRAVNWFYEKHPELEPTEKDDKK